MVPFTDVLPRQGKVSLAALVRDSARERDELTAMAATANEPYYCRYRKTYVGVRIFVPGQQERAYTAQLLEGKNSMTSDITAALGYDNMNVGQTLYVRSVFGRYDAATDSHVLAAARIATEKLLSDRVAMGSPDSVKRYFQSKLSAWGAKSPLCCT